MGLTVDFKHKDFANLKHLDLKEHTLESIVGARVQARRIIESLEPHDITSWADLIEKLETNLDITKTQLRIRRVLSKK